MQVPEDKDSLQFMILVQIDENLSINLLNEQNEKADHQENISTGWVVLRSLTEFHVIYVQNCYVKTN